MNEYIDIGSSTATIVSPTYFTNPQASVGPSSAIVCSLQEIYTVKLCCAHFASHALTRLLAGDRTVFGAEFVRKGNGLLCTEVLVTCCLNLAKRPH